MIPKVIHYFWFGRGKKNDVIERCMDSWKVHLPDYEIKEWNEDNFNVHINNFTLQAYQMKKWAFVSDYARLHILYHYGGIYLDTDLEITNSLDPFLDYEGFMGFFSNFDISGGIIGAAKGNKFIKKLLTYYENKNFIDGNGKIDEKTNVEIITEISKKHFGFVGENQTQQILDMTIFPKEYFTVRDVNVKNYAIHHYNASWLSHEEMNKHLKSYRKYYEFTVKWLDNLINNKIDLTPYKNKCIAIFGKGYIGELLVSYLQNNNVPIRQIIDTKFANDTYKDIPIVSSDTISDEVNLIIITPIHSFESIYLSLKEKSCTDIISIENLLS